MCKCHMTYRECLCPPKPKIDWTKPVEMVTTEVNAKGVYDVKILSTQGPMDRPIVFLKGDLVYVCAEDGKEVWFFLRNKKTKVCRWINLYRNSPGGVYHLTKESAESYSHTKCYGPYNKTICVEWEE